MEFRLLGPLTVVDGGRPVALGRGTKRALLAMLLLRANHVVTPGQLVEDLWGERPPGNPKATLHSHVAALRRVLERDGGERLLLTDAAGYLLRVAPGQLDVDRFESAVTEGDRALAARALAAALAAYDRGLADWRGAALADFAAEPWAQATAIRLEELRRSAVERRMEAALALGHHAELLADLEAQAEAEPLREQRWAQLMLALYRSGRQADALVAYDRLRRTLGEELGLEPGHEVARLQQAILRQDPSLDAPAAPAPAARAVRAVNVPTVLTSFVGRAHELDRVMRTLTEHRLVTLTGTGGVGKTRLAVAVADRAADLQVDEVAFVPLAGVTEASLVLPAIARLLDVAEEAGTSPLASLRGHIGDGRMLLVLDNLEQVTAAAGVVVELLGACPALRVLTTSRVPLKAAGERRVPVPPLALSARGQDHAGHATSEAAELYLDRARAVHPDLVVDGAVDAAVARLCERLDGLPLALELAASHAAVLPPQALLDRLTRRLDLSAAAHDVPRRQRTLRATLDWSFDLLGPAARRLFVRMAVFGGGAALASVEAVCGDGGADDAAGGVLEALTALVDTGLVRTEAVGVAPRFRMLETIREYALERLHERDEARGAHRCLAEHMLMLARVGKPPPGFADDRRLEHLDAEADNIHEALRWAVAEGETELAGLLAAAAYRWWFSSGRFSVGRHWTGRVLEHVDSLSPLLRAEVLLADAVLAANQGDYDHAVTRYEQSRLLWAAYDAPGGQARCLYGRAAIVNAHDPATASALLEQSLELTRRSGDDLMAVRITANLGAIAEAQSDHARARALYEDALAAASRVGSPAEVSATSVQLALMLQVTGHPERVAALANAGVAAARASGSSSALTFALPLAGVVALGAAEPALAAERFAEALAIARDSGQITHYADCLCGLAAVAQMRGEPERAVRLFAAGAAVLDRAGIVAERGADQDCYTRHLALARRELSTAACEAAWAAGQTMTDEAIAVSLRALATTAAQGR